MGVELDKNFDKDVFDTIKTAILCIFAWKSPPKSALGKISYVNFSKMAQITKKFDNFKQVVPPIDIKLE